MSAVIQRLREVNPRTLDLWLMLVLTFATGISDTVGYLGLDRVFTANMTGNLVILGMALTGGTGLPVAGPALALVGFVAGATVAGRVLKFAGAAWSRGVTALLAAVAATMIVLGTVLSVADGRPGPVLTVAVTTLLAVAMGAQAAAARHIAVKDVTTVVVTSTLTGLGANWLLGNGTRNGTARRIAAVAMLLAGAAAGALLLKADLGWALLLAGIVIAAVAAAGELTIDRSARTPTRLPGKPVGE